MRRLPSLVCALIVLAAPASASAAGPSTGGTPAPSAEAGVTYGEQVPKLGPVATQFTVAPRTLAAGGPATFTFRIDGPTRRVRVRVEFTRGGAPASTTRVRLGYKRTGRRYTRTWTPQAGALAPGDYDVALQATDDGGHALRRTARASGHGRLTVKTPPAPVALPAPGGTGAGVFPVAGEWSLGGPEARFGAPRTGHAHQGQDILAAEGTPVVAPVAGLVYWVAYQARGAGHYVVERGADGRDYVFMHLETGTVTAVKDQPLAAGQQVARAGNTGASSGAHLHFEIWPDGWYSSDASKPIDPLPELLAWAGTR